jgi:hypothetical protein
MDVIQLEFDKAYWTSQPPELRALPVVEDFDQRVKRAADLASKGFTVDVPIMVWTWDPYLVMKNRQDYGYTWVPSALQPNISVAPGVNQPGSVPYDPTHPPAGSIRVSLNMADYPPFNPPPPAPQQQAANADPVGIQSLGTLYLSVPGETYADGAKFTDSRGTFIKHVTFTPFGQTNYWEKIA